MLGKGVRILEVGSPSNSGSCWSTRDLVVQHPDGTTGKVLMREDEYEVEVLAQRILSCGVPYDLLSEFKDKVWSVAQFEESLNNAGEDL
jgi:hypothetical protein